jgi:hypothetical protein
MPALPIRSALPKREAQPAGRIADIADRNVGVQPLDRDLRSHFHHPPRRNLEIIRGVVGGAAEADEQQILPARQSGEPLPSEPSSAFETQVKHCAKQGDNANDDKVAVLSLQLGHIFEIHAVNPGDRSRYGQYCGPSG